MLYTCSERARSVTAVTVQETHLITNFVNLSKWFSAARI